MPTPTQSFQSYVSKLSAALASFDWTPVAQLTDAMRDAWKNGSQVFTCGNGGSGANAMHWVNDFVYPICKKGDAGIRIMALTANPAVITCLANDENYDIIFSKQLETYGRDGDILIAMSGSGNSPNIIKALEKAREMKIKSFAILGCDGGKSLKLADIPIHLPIDDMQIAEDFQGIIGHMIMQELSKGK